MRLWATHIQPDTTGDPDIDSVTFDWTLLDNARDIAAAHGKKLGVSIAWGRTAPRWLYLKGAYKFQVDPADNNLNNAGFDMPLPWDPVYRSYLFNFIDTFAARYDNDPTITYIVITGFQQRVENRLVNMIDASVAITDAVTSNSGAFGKVTSNSAKFLTRVGASAIVGKTIFDNSPGDNDVAVFREGTVVCDPATTPGCPAAPTDTTVYLSKQVLVSAGNVTTNIEEWIVGQGDEWKLNQQAIAQGYDDKPPLKDEVLFGKTWSPYYPDVTSGFASTRAYIPAVEMIMDKWATAFAHTPVLLTGQIPFSDANPWGVMTEGTVKQYLEQWPLGGYMVASLYALCPGDYTGIRQVHTKPKGDQWIYSLNRDEVYRDAVCADGSAIPPFGPQRAHDIAQGSWEKGDSFMEGYYPDMATEDPAMNAAWLEERARFSAPVPTATPTPTPASVLANISTRLVVGSGDNVGIGGFIVTGTQPKKVIVRAIGPSLTLPGVMANPTLSLFSPGGTLLASNDDWRNTQEAEILASGIPPANNKESAIVATLPASANGLAYTAIISGADNTTGIGVVEVYDLDASADSRLANISTRGQVGEGDGVLIGGLIVVGSDPQNVIVRALGPSLGDAGLTGALSDPVLELRDGNGNLLASNDNWRETQEAAITAAGLPPASDLEAAIVATLPGSPGGIGYTAIVRGVNGTTGVALVEVYGLAP
ncbi:MAG: beta-galactosidase [Verrucomicrobiota bacterium]|nr:beta-galactosidase [Verrucomicrobiota bacterium]